MKSPVIKAVLLAALTCAGATAACADWPDYKGFWVVGDHTTKKCEIVTSNPTIDGTVIWFSTGPYQSLDDAKLARSTISECPKEPAKPAK